MPFDPAQPAAGSPLSSQVVRDQLNDLKTLIDAGVAGPEGPQGPPGEVTQSALDGAIGGCALNPGSVSALEIVVGDPPTQATVLAVVNKLNELIGALRRP